MIPALEGSTHINFLLAAQFVATYFATPGGTVPVPGSVSLGHVSSDENPYRIAARDRNPKTVRFAPFLAAYEPPRAITNVGLFARQVVAFGRAASGAVLDSAGKIALGRCFSVVVYGQLVAENCAAVGATPAAVSVIFHALVSDLTADGLAS